MRARKYKVNVISVAALLLTYFCMYFFLFSPNAPLMHVIINNVHDLDNDVSNQTLIGHHAEHTGMHLPVPHQDGKSTLIDEDDTGTIPVEGGVQIMLAQQSRNQNEVAGNESPRLLRAEVTSIIHFSEQAKIVVNLSSNETRTCLNPRILGRLSGKYLSKIHWDNDDKHSSSTTAGVGIIRRNSIVGTYQVPEPGRYFVEIIGLLCNDFTFEADLDSICLEDPDENQLTAKSSFIDVHPDSISTTSAAIGYWKWMRNTEDPIPMYTRYQRTLHCRTPRQKRTHRCRETSSLSRFEPYEFAWSPSTTSLEWDPEPAAEEFRICTGGMSHSRVLRDLVVYWVEKLNITGVDATGWIQMKYPSDMSRSNAELSGAVPSSWKRDDLKCHVTIVSVVQWSAGRKSVYANTSAIAFPEYQEELRQGIETWQKEGVNFYLRDPHYNALGDVKTACPPVDHRSPPFIDGYKEIVRNLAREYNVPYIDTSQIMDTMWDSAEDWTHYKGEVGKIEAYAILKRILEDRGQLKTLQS